MLRRSRYLTLSLVCGLAAVAVLMLALAWPAAAMTGAPAAPLGLPWIQVNYAHHWVNVNTIPLANVSVVVARGSTIIDSGSGQADPGGNLNYQLDKSAPQMLPGDAVTVTAAGSQAVVNPIGSIEGALDLAADRAAGTLHAPFPGTLTVGCEIWSKDPGTPAPIIIQNVPANGGAWACDYSGSWDIRPGDDVAISYYEPDGDRVINVLRGPAPDLWVNKRSEGSGQAAPGGQVLFFIEYANNGTAPAEEVVLTDTLPTGTAYVTDTGHFSRDETAGTVAWALGTLPAGATGSFYVVLSNSLQANDPIVNHVEIATSSAGEDTSNNQADGTASVVDGAADVYVGKYAFPNDPLPGDSYNYAVGYGNKGPVTGGPVWLTDTLPSGTTLLSWYSRNGFQALWTRLPSGPGQAVFYAPALPGGFGDELILTLLVDAAVPLHTELVNKVCILAPPAAEQCQEHQGVWTSPARWDVAVLKEWGSGQLTAGGEINYQIAYYSNGNATAHGLMLTDTLPAGTTFITSVIDTRNGQIPFPPTQAAGQTLVWALKPLAPGDKLNFRLQLRIGAGVAAGTVITNQAQISTSDADSTPDNDLSQVVEKVYPAGPNLRVRKSYDWNWPGGGPGPNTLSYQVQFENVGTIPVDNVSITDTLPAGTTFNGNWWNQFGQPIGFAGSPGDHQLVWTLQSLEPGWSGRIGFDAGLDGNILGQGGLVFTNTAQITIPPGDPSSADNAAEVVAFSGPDLYVSKWLKAGSLYAGETITYTIRFGNRNRWPWRVSDPGMAPSVLLTDTLPAGIEFVTAIPRWDPGQSWQPTYNSGGTVAWNAWPLGQEEWAEVDVVARIGPSVAGGTVLSNTVQIADVVPGDVEAYYGNNRYSLGLPIGARVHLSMIRR